MSRTPRRTPLDPRDTERLWRARIAAGLSQQELSVRAGVHYSLISLLEAGKRDIRGVGYERVVRIARALGVEPDILWPVSPVGMKNARRPR